ncbi:MAG: hypothetical protein ACRDPR_06640 [Nocardioidaceae bacterium]
MVTSEESFGRAGGGWLCGPEVPDGELLGAVAGFNADTLARSPAAREWLAARGVDAGLAAMVGVGFSDRSLGLSLPLKNRRAGAVLRSRLQGFGVLRASGHEHLRGCVTVPVRDGDGAVVQIVGYRVGRARDERGIPATLALDGLPGAV